MIISSIDHFLDKMSEDTDPEPSDVKSIITYDQKKKPQSLTTERLKREKMCAG